MILRQGISLLLLTVVLLAGCAGAPAEAPRAKEEGELGRVVEVKADGLIFHYLRQSFWGEREFSNYSANQAQFKVDFKDDFEQRLAKNSVSASGYSFSFDSATHSIIVQCDIHDAITLSSESGYRARFEWLLKPLGLDFIDDKFEESEKGLSWKGIINGVPITVTVELPTINSTIYKAWAHPIGHCHAHAWWSD